MIIDHWDPRGKIDNAQHLGGVNKILEKKTFLRKSMEDVTFPSNLTVFKKNIQDGKVVLASDGLVMKSPPTATHG